jgi:hypothetical protein
MKFLNRKKSNLIRAETRVSGSLILVAIMCTLLIKDVEKKE